MSYGRRRPTVATKRRRRWLGYLDLPLSCETLYIVRAPSAAWKETILRGAVSASSLHATRTRQNSAAGGDGLLNRFRLHPLAGDKGEKDMASLVSSGLLYLSCARVPESARSRSHRSRCASSRRRRRTLTKSPRTTTCLLTSSRRRRRSSSPTARRRRRKRSNSNGTRCSTRSASGAPAPARRRRRSTRRRRARRRRRTTSSKSSSTRACWTAWRPRTSRRGGGRVAAARPSASSCTSTHRSGSWSRSTGPTRSSWRRRSASGGSSSSGTTGRC